ncbi:MAG: aminoglycoside 6-adenylyltransferase [Candidatus Levybacteria bacterium]|nr:aminoglycoside 6-adenylyltransferase [Candidatus Levybacteria bacterium]
MEKQHELLQKILAWSERQDTIRVMILAGSLTREDNTADDLSDLDIGVYATDHEYYGDTDQWMQEIAPVWMYLPLKSDKDTPSRLVIFEGGVKVDFLFYPLEVLDERVKDLPDIFHLGYKVLIDKDNLTEKLQPPAFKPLPAKKPTEKEFIALVEEFWFEAYHIAKYIKRGDLWSVKSRDWGVKELLRRMIEWYEKSIHGWDYDTRHLGVGMKKWVEPEIWEELYTIFAHFDVVDSSKTLQATIVLFRKVAKQTAQKLNYAYPEEVDEQISTYINSLLS